MSLPKPPRAAIVYENPRVYACLASYPIAKGHTVVVWKKSLRDLHLLSCDAYEHLMDVVDLVRDALLAEFGVRKVYLLYMDEAEHVHWHLVPRWNEEGFDVFRHRPRRVRTFPLAEAIRRRITSASVDHPELQ